MFQHLCEERCSMEKCKKYVRVVHEITNVSKKISAAVVHTRTGTHPMMILTSQLDEKLDLK